MAQWITIIIFTGAATVFPMLLGHRWDSVMIVAGAALLISVLILFVLLYCSPAIGLLLMVIFVMGGTLVLLRLEATFAPLAWMAMCAVGVWAGSLFIERWHIAKGKPMPPGWLG